MTTLLEPTLPVHEREAVPERVGRRVRRRLRREAAEADRRAVRLAELHLLRDVVADAAAIVETGWVRGGWFAYVDDSGTRRVTTSLLARRAEGRPVVGACLVGAVVQAGGGLGAAPSQPVQRALDLVWHALRSGPEQPVRWCPGPSVRAAHVRDLTRWNDTQAHGAGEVVGLLQAADRLAVREIERRSL